MHRSTIAAVVAVTILLAGACGGGDDDSASGGGGGGGETSCPVDAFKEESGKTQVVVWSSYVGRTQQALEKIADAYNQSQQQVEVDVQVQGTSYAEMFDKFQKAIPTGDLPAITIGEDIETRYMVDSGVVVPAQDCIDADDDPRASREILPAVEAAYTVDGKQYPAAMNVSTIVLYYNKDHFRAAGLDPEQPPTTLEEVMEAAKALKAAGVSKQPFVMKQDSWFLEQWVTGLGQTLVNGGNGRDEVPTEATLDNDVVRGGFEWLAEMKRLDLMNAVPGTDGQVNHYFALATGAGSMGLETSTAITTIDGVLQGTFDPADLGLGSEFDSFKGIKLTIDLGVALNPGVEEPGVGQVGGGAWYITNTGTDAVQSAAWDFIKYFNQQENQVIWTQEGSYLPINEEVRNDPTITADWTTSNRGKWLAIAYEGITTLDPEFPGALIGPYDRFRDAMGKAIESVTLSGGSVDEAVTEVQRVATEELQSYSENTF